MEKDNETQIQWIVKIMAEQGHSLDFSIHSLLEIDKFLQTNFKNSFLSSGSKLKKNIFSDFEIVYSLALYIENILLEIPNTSVITQHDEEYNHTVYGLRIQNKFDVFTEQKLMKRIKNGFSESIYPFYYEITKDYFNEEFDSNFYEIERIKPLKAWWDFK